MTEIERLTAEVERLTQTNSLLQECQANHNWWVKRAGELEAENTRLTAENVELRVARDAWINYAFVGAVVPKQGIPAESGQTVIEKLQAENTRLKAPVSDEEANDMWEQYALDDVVRRSGFIIALKELLASHATRTPPQEGQ